MLNVVYFLDQTKHNLLSCYKYMPKSEKERRNFDKSSKSSKENLKSQPEIFLKKIEAKSQQPTKQTEGSLSDL